MALPTKQTLSVSSLFSEITAENKLSKLVSITVVSLNVRDLHKTEIKGKNIPMPQNKRICYNTAIRNTYTRRWKWMEKNGEFPLFSLYWVIWHAE